MNRLQTLAINASGFAFDPMHGESFSVSATGVFIISELAKGTEIGEIAQKISDEYDAEYEQCYTDTLEFINRLKFYGLVNSK